MKKISVLAKDIQLNDRIKVGRIPLEVKNIKTRVTGDVLMECKLFPGGFKTAAIILPRDWPVIVRRSK